MGDAGGLAIIVLFTPLVIIGAASWIVQHVIALQAPPTKRAGSIVGLGYLVATVLLIFGVPDDYWWAVPFAGVPGALLLFWWWRRDFRQRWIDDTADFVPNVERENDDWRVGLIFVAGVLAIAAVRVLVRMASNGQM